MKTITNITYPAFALVAVASFALPLQVRAACQEGCLTNENTVLGDDALLNHTHFYNTAVGFEALFSNAASGNTATGDWALRNNGTGSDNTANGVTALAYNITGGLNTGIGWYALIFNQSGSYNTGIGAGSLGSNLSGSNNIALGFDAGGYVEGDNNIDIGNIGVAGESGIMRLGTEGTHTATYIAGIRTSALAVGTAIGITDDGRLGVRASSRRYKEQIKSMAEASEAILSLQPVTFRYKKELDPKSTPQFGLVAEDVEKVNPALVARDEQGKPYTVRYEAVNAMLLNEFLKARRQIDAQQKQIEALTSGLQKLTAQVEASKPALQVVKNP